jgi:hypothetical protein
MNSQFGSFIKINSNQNENRKNKIIQSTLKALSLIDFTVN